VSTVCIIFFWDMDVDVEIGFWFLDLRCDRDVVLGAWMEGAYGGIWR
jgi:hypothetical protein